EPWHLGTQCEFGAGAGRVRDPECRRRRFLRQHQPLNTSAGKTMKHHIQRPLLTVALGILAAGAAVAQTASRPGPVRFETVTMAVEVFAGSVTLPSGPNGTLVMATCHDCPLQSFTTDTATGYFVDGRPASL